MTAAKQVFEEENVELENPWMHGELMDQYDGLLNVSWRMVCELGPNCV